MGLVKVNNDGKIQECFKLSYKNGDLLYVSIHSLHKISKYNGPDGKEIVLSKLGSPAWKSLKQKTKTSWAAWRDGRGGGCGWGGTMRPPA